MRIRNIFFLSLVVMAFTGVTASRAEADVNVNVNFSELNDYGEWVIVPGYGTVWRPDADPGWRPFTYGHWVYTSDGWMWDSYEPFGWIVCHYGNWYYDDDHGWVWLPGYTWSTARVRWYVTDNEIGWAPMLPAPRHGYRQSSVRVEWSFCPVPFFTAGEVRNHVAFRANPERSGVRVHVYAGPPRREFVQRIVGTPIVSIKFKKVRVTTREKPLVRVEVQSQKRPHVEVPVGPKYKRVMVQSRPEPGKTVTVTHEKAVQPPVRQEQTDNPRVKTETRSTTPEAKPQVRTRDNHDNQGGKSKVETHSTTPEAKVQVRTRDNQDNQGGKSDDNNRGKKKER